MSASSTPEQGTAGVQSPHPDAGTHTVSIQRDVEVRLVPVGHENGDEDYHVYLEPVGEGDPALGTVMPYRPDGIWYVHLAPRYGDGPVSNVGGLDLALRRLLELALDEDLSPKYVELPSRNDAAEEPEEEELPPAPVTAEELDAMQGRVVLRNYGGFAEREWAVCA